MHAVQNHSNALFIKETFHMDNVISDNQPGMKVVFIICFVVRLNLIHLQNLLNFITVYHKMVFENEKQFLK
jgi:hypothetical protein